MYAYVAPSRVGGLGLTVTADGTALRSVRFGVEPPSDIDPPAGLITAAVTQLARYFDGELKEFDLPLAVLDGSDFEREVWRAIARIPYGHTRTYGDIAKDLGDPMAARAVGTACNHNPHPVIVPCHRVVGAGGKMVGFGGGLRRKRILLELEARASIGSWFGQEDP
jgi:methylated-DNA-[protein]-cysteine S-methyltransferase